LYITLEEGIFRADVSAHPISIVEVFGWATIGNLLAFNTANGNGIPILAKTVKVTGCIRLWPRVSVAAYLLTLPTILIK
jgi:hypothetical protein